MLRWQKKMHLHLEQEFSQIHRIISVIAKTIRPDKINYKEEEKKKTTESLTSVSVLVCLRLRKLLFSISHSM